MHNRFFCLPENISDKSILITDKKEIHHIVDVLKFNQGNKIIIFDGHGREFEGTIKKITKNEIDVSIEKKLEKNKGFFQITLACAIPKKSKFDFIVEKATELGVDRIIPLRTERTEASFTKERMLSKVQHWRKISIGASKQSERSFIPQIDEVNTFKKAVSEIKKYDLAVLPTLQGKRICIAEALNSFKGKNILLFIGPEGDFTKDEIELALRQGCKPISLGKNVLKVDTAAISAIAVFNSILESKNDKR